MKPKKREKAQENFFFYISPVRGAVPWRAGHVALLRDGAGRGHHAINSAVNYAGVESIHTYPPYAGASLAPVNEFME